MSERVSPPKPWEPAEIGIVRVDLGLVLHGQRRNVRVRDEVGTDTGCTEISPEVRQVLRIRVDRCDMRLLEPVLHVRHGVLYGEGRRKRSWMRHQSHEPR